MLKLVHEYTTYFKLVTRIEKNTTKNGFLCDLCIFTTYVQNIE